MKISIIPDAHCGYKYGEERGEDSFAGLGEIMDKSSDADLILIAGDLFDARLPRPEVFARTARILSRAHSSEGKARLVEIVGKDHHDFSPLAIRGVPIVAIHGNHDRRSPHLVNPVQGLEHAGILVHLDCQTAVFDIEGQKVAIHGMSSVSERYAKDVMTKWNPKPIPGATNILMIHQSIDPYIYSPLEPPSLKLDELPDGFDLYVAGHMHWYDTRKLKQGDFLLTGSATYTSIHRLEAEQTKSFFKYDGKNIERVPLASQRKVIWREIELKGDVRGILENELRTLVATDPKPIVMFKLKGRLPSGVILPNMSDLETKFADKALVYINKNITTESVGDHSGLMSTLRGNTLAPEEHGMKLLHDNLVKANCVIKVDDIFELLANGETDAILAALTGERAVA